MISMGKWFPEQIAILCKDYREYINLLGLILRHSENPLKADFLPALREEKEQAGKIINHERVLSRWLKDVPSLGEQFSPELSTLQDLRNECLKLRNKGRSSLKTGLTLVDQEQRKIEKNRLPKSTKKEAAPRLIDITL